MKKCLVGIILLICLFILSYLTGCTSGAQKEAAGKAKITYMMWGTPSEKATVDKYLESFRKKRPDIYLDVIHVPSMQYSSKLQTLMAGQTPPDVMYMGLEDFPRYTQGGAFMDLQPLIDSDKDFNLNDFYPQLMEPFKYEGHYYGVAKDFATLVLYYNKDLFDKSGVSYPNDKWTWKDFRSAAEKLTKDTDGNGKIDQYGFVLETWFGEWLPWVWQHGGEVMSPDGKKWLLGDPRYLDKNVEALEFLTGLIYGPKPVAPSPSVTTDQGTYYLFKTGKVAMCTYGRWMCMDFKDIKDFKWDVSVLPSDQKRASTLFTVCYAISSKTQHPKEAWDLVKFLTGPEGQIATAESGHAIPSVKSVAESDHFLKAPVLPHDLNHQANLDSLVYARSAPTNPVWSEINTVVTRDMDLLWRGKEKPRDTILKLQPKVEKIFKENKIQ